MELKQAIADWDGKAVAAIVAIYGRFSLTPTFIPQLIQFLAQEPLQMGASWLLKHHFENNRQLTQGEIADIYQLLPELKHWSSKLHILQCIPFMPIAAAQAAQVHQFLETCVTDKNKMVRAWAYNGFYELAVQHESYKAEAKQRLDNALTDEAASVKARVRNVLKRGGL